MKLSTMLLIAFLAPSIATAAEPLTAPSPAESLGVVSFAVSCAPAVRAPFSRGIALLHDFWYEEAEPQFERIAKADPHCAMAHWGIAMSVFHQIWDRPDDAAEARGLREMRLARQLRAATAREREYIAALGGFFSPGKREYQARIDGYAAAMGRLHARYPEDIDAATFYALSLLASEAPDDSSLTHERQALAVLDPLWTAHADHPGVVHYIIHACDTPSLAQRGLAAAERYGQIAASGPHAVHMPGHIFARLGMWQADIDSNAASVEASNAAESHHMSGWMDQFHSDDFLLYAYLQSAQDSRAKAVLGDAAAALTHFEAMPSMGDHYMTGMFPYYRAKLPIFFSLEMRDWKAAADLQPVAGAPPESTLLTYWARTLAAARLREPEKARAELAQYDTTMELVKQGRHAYYAASTGAQISRGEMLGWIAFAEGNAAEALKSLHASADLQDKVGQGEVDIPAREMLADILLELGRPGEALVEYERALALSPNRFNGLFNAGLAAEKAGEPAKAKSYYAALLKSTHNGVDSSRAEFAHVKSFMSRPEG
jgi:tetratricopeptide (TPR) repeat protein